MKTAIQMALAALSLTSLLVLPGCPASDGGDAAKSVAKTEAPAKADTVAPAPSTAVADKAAPSPAGVPVPEANAAKPEAPTAAAAPAEKTADK